ncbi:MAG: transketolase family protein [Eubacteriales bacterium]
MADVQRIATRESYGETLVELGKEYPNLVVLDADLAGATKTALFGKAYPDRHINCGIAECNMLGIAAGMAATGKIPFVSSFAMFAVGRAFEQIRNTVAYSKLNVKIGATHAGITVGEDGASHQCNEDIALMRAIPGMVIVNPSDDIEARAAVKAAIEYEGPMYLRFGRSVVPVIHDLATYEFVLGKGILLREGTDLTIIATGLCVSFCIEVVERMATQGISVELINIHTIKPLDEEMVLASARKTKKVITVEEHSVIGGLGSAVADVLSEKEPTHMKKIGIYDQYGESGSANDMLKKYKLDTEGILEQVLEWIK